MRKLAAGTEILVTASRSQTVTRRLLSADDSGIVLLNLTDPGVPRNVIATIRDIVNSNPGLLADATDRGFNYQEKNLRLNPEGIFVADQRVAELIQVITKIDRSQVAELALPADEHRAAKRVLIGALVGGAIGAFIGGNTHEGGDRTPLSDPGFMAMVYGGIGAGAGGLFSIGITSGRPRTIYRAP